jgi:hypothetical protein
VDVETRRKQYPFFGDSPSNRLSVRDSTSRQDGPCRLQRNVHHSVLHSWEKRSPLRGDPDVRMSTTSIDSEEHVRLLGSHDRIITCNAASHYLSEVQSQNPRSRQLGYRQFPGENMRSNLVLGSITEAGL